VRLADGRVERAPDWSRLTEHAFGVTIPVKGLSTWLRGIPRANARFDVEHDDAGRVALLRQDGWEIVYAYDAASRRPMRLSLQYPGAEAIEVRIVVDRWQ
jgi:outer membrane lipoprotein LolB